MASCEKWFSVMCVYRKPSKQPNHVCRLSMVFTSDFEDGISKKGESLVKLRTAQANLCLHCSLISIKPIGILGQNFVKVHFCKC